MRVARLLFRALTCLGPEIRTVRRRGIRWRLDLSDGIDLSIYLTGTFGLGVLRTIRKIVDDDCVLIDVGSNRGAVTIPLATRMCRGRIIALDPVREHCDRLMNDLSLNQNISCEVVVEQAFVAQSPETKLPDVIGAKWNLVDFDTSGNALCASPCPTDGAVTTSVDDVVARHGISRLSLIKIDVDGYELDVINGALKTLRDLGPPIVMEWSPTAMGIHGVSPADLAEVLECAGYQPSLIRWASARRISWEELLISKSRRTSRDLLLTK